MTSSGDAGWAAGGTAPDCAVRVLRRSSGRLRLAVLAADPDASELERAVRSAPGVRAASFSGLTGNLLVTFDARRTDDEEVLATVSSAVRRATPSPALRATPPPARLDGIAVRDLEPPGGWMAAEGSCVVRAPAADCVAAILDFAAYADWQQYVTRVEILERDGRGRGAVVRTEGRVGEQSVMHVMRYRYPSANRIVWEQVEGELDAIRGEWRLRSTGRAGTRATYRLEIRPGLRLRLLLRGPLYEQIRDMLMAHTLGELRSRVEGAAGRPAS